MFLSACMASKDARDGLLGRLFAYGSLIRAKRLIGNGSSPEEKELITEIVQQLFGLAKQKTFLREPAVNLVFDLASRVSISIRYFTSRFSTVFKFASSSFRFLLLNDVSESARS